jgi:uncharacterized membrane protein
MKKIFLIGMMSAFTFVMMAQNNGNRERRGFNSEQRYEQLKTELNLSAKQLDSLKVAERDLFTGFGRGGGGGATVSPEQRQAEMKKRNEQLEKRLKNFLDEKQIAKYKELRERQQQQRQGQGNRDRDPQERQQRQGNGGGGRR